MSEGTFSHGPAHLPFFIIALYLYNKHGQKELLGTPLRKETICRDENLKD